MNLHDWLIFLHVMAAFVAVSALVVLWALVPATRTASPMIEMKDAMRIGQRIAGPMVGAGLGVALVVGIGLTFEVEGYALWDPWIAAALVLWAVASWSGMRSGKLFETRDLKNRAPAIRLQALSTVSVIVILALMFWKPGA